MEDISVIIGRITTRLAARRTASDARALASTCIRNGSEKDAGDGLAPPASWEDGDSRHNPADQRELMEIGMSDDQDRANGAVAKAAMVLDDRLHASVSQSNGDPTEMNAQRVLGLSRLMLAPNLLRDRFIRKRLARFYRENCNESGLDTLQLAGPIPITKNAGASVQRNTDTNRNWRIITHDDDRSGPVREALAGADQATPDTARCRQRPRLAGDRRYTSTRPPRFRQQ